MSQPKEYYFHSGARFVYRCVGGFFLGLGLLAMFGKFTESDPFSDPDIWFMIILGGAFSAVGLWTILLGQWGRITFGEESAKISTWIGRLTVNYSQITSVGMMVGSIPYRGFRAYMIRKRTGGIPVNLIMRDGSRMVKSCAVSSFENYTEIIDEFHKRSGQEVQQLNQATWHEWIQNPTAG